MNGPNLFDFATKELSQDAFICWLACWADPALRDENAALHATATAFLRRLLEVGKGPTLTELRSIEVTRQEHNIDVLLVLNGDTAIIIEDKIGSSEHSNQLDNYKGAIAGTFSADRIAAVYLKTLDQGDYLRVDGAGYGRFLRRDLLDILGQGERLGVKNDIFADFHRRLQQIEDAVQSYGSVPLAQWNNRRNRWRGFFMALQQRLEGGQWDQSGHQGGRTLTFRWHWADGKFLALIGNELWFRIEVPDESQRKAKWVEWSRAIMKQSVLSGIRIKGTLRREGRRMGVAVLDGDYRQQNEQGVLDFERTVEKLKQAESLMDAALKTV